MPNAAPEVAPPPPAGAETPDASGEKGNMATKLKEAAVAKAKKAASFLSGLRGKSDAKKGLEAVVTLDEGNAETDSGTQPDSEPTDSGEKTATKKRMFDKTRTRVQQKITQFKQTHGRNKQTMQTEDEATLAQEMIDGQDENADNSTNAPKKITRRQRLRARVSQQVTKINKKYDREYDASKVFVEVKKSGELETGEKFSWKASTERAGILRKRQLTAEAKAWAMDNKASVDSHYDYLTAGDDTKLTERQKYRYMAEAIQLSRRQAGDEIHNKIQDIRESGDFQKALEAQKAEKRLEDGKPVSKREQIRMERKLLVDTVKGKPLSTVDADKPGQPEPQPVETPEGRYSKRIADLRDQLARGEIKTPQFNEKVADAYKQFQEQQSAPQPEASPPPPDTKPAAESPEDRYKKEKADLQDQLAKGEITDDEYNEKMGEAAKKSQEPQAEEPPSGGEAPILPEDQLPGGDGKTLKPEPESADGNTEAPGEGKSPEDVLKDYGVDLDTKEGKALLAAVKGLLATADSDPATSAKEKGKIWSVVLAILAGLVMGGVKIASETANQAANAGNPSS